MSKDYDPWAPKAKHGTLATAYREERENPQAIDMKTLAQVSMAGIDIYANWVVSLVSRHFKLSLKGQRNMNLALNNLPVFRTTDEKLTFGWCSEHALRNLGVHQHMYEHLALEVAISEAFPVRYSAQVLWAMSNLYATDQDVAPHFRDMVKLVNSSKGLFMSTDFAQLVEGYLRMLPDSGSGTAADQEMPAAEAMATALSMLAHVTTEDKKQMTLVSGRVLAWFVTVAEWLFDLRTSIYLASGDRIYGTDGDQPTQLLAIFSPTSNLQTSLGSWTDDSEQALAAGTGSMYLPGGNPIPGIPFGGRIVWTSLLSQVFGQSFHHLDREESRLLGTTLGVAARAIEDSNVRHGNLSKHSSNSSRPVGAALVKLLTEWLPELRHLQGRMERLLKLPYEESRKTYVESIGKLQEACACELCKPSSASDLDDGITPPYGYCLTVLVETILVLGMVLSRLTVAPAIYPTAQGVRSLYRRQCARRLKVQQQPSSEMQISDHVYGDEWNASNLKRMQNCAELFSSSRPVSDLPENLVGLAHEGICVYLVGIESSRPASREEDLELIRVTSGGIGVRFKVFSRAALGELANSDQFEYEWEKVECTHLSEPLFCT